MTILHTLKSLSLDEMFLADVGITCVVLCLLYLAYRLKWIRSTKPQAYMQAGRAAAFVCIITAALLPLAVRMGLFPWRPLPQPHIHDEFGHLLVADTLASGRLTNPPHALWRHLDTIYVIQRPTYSSIYPIGQGALLAAGKLATGSPWAGVLIATALMTAAVCWAFIDLLPLPWIAIGGLVAGFTYGLRWVDSYWGGAFCAFGGALVFGALLRLQRSVSIWMALLLGIGWSITWLIRPFESIFLLMFSWGCLAVLVASRRYAWKRWVLPLSLVVAVEGCAGTVTAAQNRAVSGSFITFPYHLLQADAGVPQTLLWQSPVPPPKFRFPEMERMYAWQLQEKKLPVASRLSSVVHTVWDFFVTPWYSIPFACALFAYKDRRVLLSWLLAAFATAAGLLYPFFFPHYIAAYTCIFVFLIVRGCMVVWNWRIRETTVGPWLVSFLMIGGLLKIVVTMVPIGISAPSSAVFSTPRSQIASRLSAAGGRHVVFVRYGPKHNFHDEWVYNTADIDHSPIVWCRWMGLNEDEAVMRYYPDRKFWTVEIGGAQRSVNLSPYLDRNNRIGSYSQTSETLNPNPAL